MTCQSFHPPHCIQITLRGVQDIHAVRLVSLLSPPLPPKRPVTQAVLMMPAKKVFNKRRAPWGHPSHTTRACRGLLCLCSMFSLPPCPLPSISQIRQTHESKKFPCSRVAPRIHGVNVIALNSSWSDNCYFVFSRYLLYDVNPPEGFNLRRDVYIRIASLMKTLLKSENWVLVLPPWGRLYHWQSPDILQVRIPWSEFFDLPSLNKNIPVIEYEQFLAGKVWNNAFYTWLNHGGVFCRSLFSHMLLSSCMWNKKLYRWQEEEWEENFWGQLVPVPCHSDSKEVFHVTKPCCSACIWYNVHTCSL